jgi:hypothetical protein|nr:MAG TPA: hypothetical protein [Bacteriophage sp.]
MRKEFIKNVLDVEVDGFTCSVHYIVRAMYDIIGADGFATIKQEVIKDVTMTDKEIEARGGASKVLADFKNTYAPLCCN